MRELGGVPLFVAFARLVPLLGLVARRSFVTLVVRFGHLEQPLRLFQTLQGPLSFGGAQRASPFAHR